MIGSKANQRNEKVKRIKQADARAVEASDHRLETKVSLFLS